MFVALALTGVASAQAQLDVPNPYHLGEQAVEENPQVPDTDHTPRAKETELWDQHHGARFPDAERPGSRGPHGAAGDQGAEIETEFDGPN